VLLAFSIGAVLFGMLVQAGVVSGMAQFSQPDNRLGLFLIDGGLITVSTLVSVVAGALFFLACIRMERVIRFTDEVVGEVRQVTFPTRDEALRASTTVVLTTIFTAGLLAIYDLVWKNLADIFLLGA